MSRKFSAVELWHDCSTKLCQVGGSRWAGGLQWCCHVCFVRVYGQLPADICEPFIGQCVAHKDVVKFISNLIWVAQAADSFFSTLSFHQLLAVGRWFPPGTPVSSTRKLISSSSSFHRLDMTLTVAEALNPNKPIKLLYLPITTGSLWLPPLNLHRSDASLGFRMVRYFSKLSCS